MFTKRHFQAIADTIKNSDTESKAQLAQDLAELFQEDNPRFDSAKFFRACGINARSA
jgi:hypothetical protein